MFKDSFLAHLPLLLLTLCFSFAVNAQEPDIQKGKSLFNANCAACHKLKKRAVGPALAGVSAKYDKEWLYSWIKNSTAMVKSGDAQAVAIYEEYNGSVMTSFPQLSNEDIDNILAYSDYTPPAPAATAMSAAVPAGSGGGFTNDLILAVLMLVLAALVTMLFLVNKTLNKIAAANGVEIIKKEKRKRTPLWKAYAQNPFLVFVTGLAT